MKDNLWDVVFVPIPDDEVICDLCNFDIDDEQGGSFIGSYCVCSDCTTGILSRDGKKEEMETIEGSVKAECIKRRRGEKRASMIKRV